MSYKLFKPELFKKIKFPVYSEVKQDGLYVDTIVYKDSVLYRSRSGKELNFTLPEPVERKLRELAEYPGIPYVLHGEALVIDDTRPNGVQSREIGNGYLNQYSEDIDKNLVKIVVWDIVSLEEYNKRKSNTIYDYRRHNLEYIVNYVNSSHLELGERLLVNNINDVISHFKACRKRGLEGTIVKDKNLLWEDKKVSKGIKLKNEFEAEYKVIGYIPHKKKENWIGSLLVESEDGKVSFGVGSGLTDKLRQLPFEYYKQKIISVKGNDLVQSESKDTWSVTHSRFVELREDKTKANTFDEILEQKDSIIFILEKCGESQ
jgi:ATP-dependent DNA ligase